MQRLGCLYHISGTQYYGMHYRVVLPRNMRSNGMVLITLRVQDTDSKIAP